MKTKGQQKYGSMKAHGFPKHQALKIMFIWYDIELPKSKYVEKLLYKNFFLAG